MNFKQHIKRAGCFAASLVAIDHVLRFMYRERLLVVMYHGVTKKDYLPPVWTQLPVTVFEQHIQWLAKYYHPVSLTEVVEAVVYGRSLPDRSVLVTFDDGLKNNLTVAYPILKKQQVPAAIFLTVDFVGTDHFFWVDELWLLIKEAARQQIKISINAKNALHSLDHAQLWETYLAEVECLKRIPEEERQEKMAILDDAVSFDKGVYRQDFGMLSWDDVRGMDKEGLVEFGAHTATHRILTSMEDDQLYDELFGAKERLEKKLGHGIDAFCYPNGRLGVDYLQEHRNMLKKGV